MLAACLVVLLLLLNVDASDHGMAVYRCLVRVGAQDAVQASRLRHADAALLVGWNRAIRLVDLLRFGLGRIALAKKLILIHER